jgi:hypothetical protein
MKTLLTFLSGKKGAIASIIGLITVYLQQVAILGDNEAILIMGITTVIFGGASYLTGKIIYNK